MPVEGLVAGVEAIGLLVQALIELMMALIQLAGIVVELLIHVVVFLFSYFAKKEVTPAVSLKDKLSASWQKRFGAQPADSQEQGKLSHWNPYSKQATPPFQWKRWHTYALGIWLGLLATVAILLFLIWGKRFDIVVTEQEVQETVVERFPMTKSILQVAAVTFESPVIHLDEKANLIHASLDCKITIKGVPFDMRGTTQITGQMEYRPDQGAFYLQELQIKKIDLRGVPAQWEVKARDAMAMVAREVMRAFPVYRLKEANLKERAARLVLKKVRVEQGQMILTMGIGG
ncbi:MAG: DUF1439 domain-containing protein [Planctomycetia bacterium]|nr:DUF1439 domain-containing protein [Planctomycetia bacterium]